MTLDGLSKVLLAALPVVAGVLQYLRTRSGRRSEIHHNLELLKALPEGSTARSKLTKHIDAAVLALLADETEKRRDPLGIVLGAVLLTSSVAVGIFAIRSEGLALALLLVAFALFMLGAVGFIQDVVPRKRDARGRPIRGE